MAFGRLMPLTEADGRLRAQTSAALGQPPDRHLEGRIGLMAGLGPVSWRDFVVGRKLVSNLHAFG